MKADLPKRFLKIAFATALTLLSIQSIAWGSEEIPLPLPKVEGSKSFDMEIDGLNRKGIKLFELEKFSAAGDQFKKGFDLAQQLRDPSLGIISFNLALSLHRAGHHEEATPYFSSAKKFARGNKQILESALLKRHECGFNPSIDCQNLPPAEMTIEGSN